MLKVSKEEMTMEKSKKTLKMIGICIIGLVIVVAVNMLKKPSDPFKASTNKFRISTY